MSRARLDPAEALTGPLYAVAVLMVVIPAADFLLSVASPQPSSVQWRFAAVGLLSGFTLTPILGLALALVVAGIRRHAVVQWIIVVLCLLSSVLLLVLSTGFVLDVLQLRASVQEQGRQAFQSAWTRALLKHVLAAIVLWYLGWRARRMIPSIRTQREPKSVHVISK